MKNPASLLPALFIAAFGVIFALVAPMAPAVAGSGRPIGALDAGAPAVSTDLVEIARPELANPTRHRAYSLTLANLLTFTNARTGQEYQLGRAGWKAGATAGWVVAAGANLYEATLPASQTASTLVIPIEGLKVGWTITAIKVEAQIESAGGTVTLDANLRKLTNAAADPTDASVGSITQVSVTADTKVEAEKLGFSEVIAADEWIYLVVTGTTAASTDIRFLGATITVTET